VRRPRRRFPGSVPDAVSLPTLGGSAGIDGVCRGAKQQHPLAVASQRATIYLEVSCRNQDRRLNSTASLCAAPTANSRAITKYRFKNPHALIPPQLSPDDRVTPSAAAQVAVILFMRQSLIQDKR
jgi:hypothetical protein